MTAYSRERANGVPTRFIDVSEHPRIKRIALGIDAQDGQTAITIHGYTANGEAIVLEHAIVENGSTIVHYGVETGGRKPLSEIVERFKPEGLLLVSDAGLNAEDVPERYRRYRQAALDRHAGKGENQ